MDAQMGFKKIRYLFGHIARLLAGVSFSFLFMRLG